MVTVRRNEGISFRMPSRQAEFGTLQSFGVSENIWHQQTSAKRESKEHTVQALGTGFPQLLLVHWDWNFPMTKWESPLCCVLAHLFHCPTEADAALSIDELATHHLSCSQCRTAKLTCKHKSRTRYQLRRSLLFLNPLDWHVRMGNAQTA